jgi:hypothetical protein
VERLGDVSNIGVGALLMSIVVKNPLSPVEHPGGIGVNCEMFELGVEQFVVNILVTSPCLLVNSDRRTLLFRIEKRSPLY